MEPSESNFILAKACMTYLLFSRFEIHLLITREDRLPVHSKYMEKHYFLSYAARNWPAHFGLTKDSHELLRAWYDICNTKSKRFETWTNACRIHPCKGTANFFEVACSLGHDTIVKQLLRPSIDLEKYHGTRYGTVLACAVRAGHHAVVDILISHGAATDTRDGKGQTPLYTAALMGAERMVRKLLCNGASLDIADDGGRTPLFSAVRSESVNIVNMMLEKGASTDVRDREGLTPLTYAAWINSGRIVKILLEKAQDAYLADLTTTNLEPDGEHMQELMSNVILREVSSLDFRLWQGMTVLHWAAKYGLDKIVQKLLEKGASVDIEDEEKSTALVHAVVEGHTGVVQVLLAHGASKDVQDTFSRTLLMRATAQKHKDIIQILLENGAPVDVGDHNGQTALHHAANSGGKDIAQMLLDAGADPNALDNGHLKPLDLAEWRRNQPVMELLEALTNDDYMSPVQ